MQGLTVLGSYEAHRHACLGLARALTLHTLTGSFAILFFGLITPSGWSTEPLENGISFFFFSFYSQISSSVTSEINPVHCFQEKKKKVLAAVHLSNLAFCLVDFMFN